jgi:NADPH:quinone reductase-like Zn-dependent oxidoreductase
MATQAQTMKAWQLHAFGYENLTLDEIKIPVPGPNEILIKVGAVSMNFRDQAIVEGYYEPKKVPSPLIPVSDTAGKVVQVGENVSRFKVGDRVVSHMYSKWVNELPSPNEPDFCLGSPLHGGLSEYMLLDEEAAVLTPSNLTDEQAATLPIAALTSWFALVTYGNLQKGDTVVIQGTGGVSIFGIQIAHALGARVIVTTSSDEKGEKARKLGADEIINYKATPDWHKVVTKLTNGVGADHILDVVGGDELNKSVQAAKVRGQISVIGFIEGQTSHLDLMQVIFRQTRFQGIAVGHRAAFEEMNKAFEQYDIRPVIDTIYDFKDAKKAYDHLARGPFGKIVIKVGQND